ncbi:hypothetical protein ATANTOWER_011734 [Ataeniobius toweri]|uniref:Uncharacterized protein n=1 Tax=Ataeniobius toweri TaxID=208326 RepID=A0ABU7BR44_9TELE|nr:hypothetical protein [Ataeniobius toweri]
MLGRSYTTPQSGSVDGEDVGEHRRERRRHIMQSSSVADADGCGQEGSPIAICLTADLIMDSQSCEGRYTG